MTLKQLDTLTREELLRSFSENKYCPDTDNEVALALSEENSSDDSL